MSAAATERILVSVRLFAILRQDAGADRIELSLPAGATVGDALRQLAETEVLRDRLTTMRVALAVNRDYASASTVLEADDELALIPPLSGGDDGSEAACAENDDSGQGAPPDRATCDRAGTKDRGRARIHARVSEQPLDACAVAAAVADPDAGAIVSFAGVTRTVPELRYEAYGEMAIERIRAIAGQCAARAGVRAIAVEHRVGAVPLGEPSVIVAASAAHRGEAFAAAREAIDRIKAQAPIWKQEVGADGERRWVDGAPVGAPLDSKAANGTAPAPADRLTHLGEDGRSRMVDVGEKPESVRVAIARARLRMSPSAAAAVQRGDGPKGEVLGVARIAGIQAAKQTGQLVPLAHPLPLTFADVSASVEVERGIVELVAEARTVARTGVEMEAMTAASVAALTVYDMVKGLERDVQIEQVVLLAKRGGRSDYTREGD